MADAIDYAYTQQKLEKMEKEVDKKTKRAKAAAMKIEAKLKPLRIGMRVRVVGSRHDSEAMRKLEYREGTIIDEVDEGIAGDDDLGEVEISRKIMSQKL